MAFPSRVNDVRSEDGWNLEAGIHWSDFLGSGHDHRIPGSKFLPFSGVFRQETTSLPRVPVGNRRNRASESSTWDIKAQKSKYKRLFYVDISNKI
jgi:hypothetical protein